MSDIEYSVITSDVIKSFDCIGNYKAKPILAFLCDDLHISSKLLYLTTSHY